MSNEELSAYLLMAGGFVWVLVGVIGWVRHTPSDEIVRDRTEEDAPDVTS